MNTLFCPSCRSEYSAAIKDCQCSRCGVGLVQREELKAMDDRVVTEILARVGLTTPPYTIEQLEGRAAQLTELEWMTVVGRKALNTYADDRFARHCWMRLTAKMRAEQRRAGLEARRGVCQCCGQPLPAPKRKRKKKAKEEK